MRFGVCSTLPTATVNIGDAGLRPYRAEGSVAENYISLHALHTSRAQNGRASKQSDPNTNFGLLEV